MIQITITVHTEDDIMDYHKKDAILEVLQEAEEEGTLGFAFDVMIGDECL